MRLCGAAAVDGRYVAHVVAANSGGWIVDGLAADDVGLTVAWG